MPAFPNFPHKHRRRETQVFSHAVVYGLYLALEGGTSPLPSIGQETASEYAARLYQGLSTASPTLEGFLLYTGFLVGTALLSAVCPGIEISGRPLPSLGGKHLMYNCNGVAVWWATLVALALCEYRGGVTSFGAFDRLAQRCDDARCAEKYGADWDTYIRRVPYVFVPGLV